eukprot:scaffold434_cov186-Pinguiococcus_pyrenoidosus.AAC.34
MCIRTVLGIGRRPRARVITAMVNAVCSGQRHALVSSCRKLVKVVSSILACTHLSLAWSSLRPSL